MAVLVGVAVFVLVAWMMYRILFDSWEEFKESVHYWLKPDLVSLIEGDYENDWWAEMKLFVWLLPSVGMGYGVYCVLQ